MDFDEKHMGHLAETIRDKKSHATAGIVSADQWLHQLFPSGYRARKSMPPYHMVSINLNRG